ncbi:hypothetical protein MLD38_003308 [Melastoma candidum]|uniref:Uncharacterized protein n=1 Tax=Melastoma candidum TaxID=119954 RepID=A0ACB9S1E2_9MYRT|nr:hypothetical protein MLD38_003308 [Melastoma candidum]
MSLRDPLAIFNLDYKCNIIKIFLLGLSLFCEFSTKCVIEPGMDFDGRFAAMVTLIFPLMLCSSGFPQAEATKREEARMQSSSPSSWPVTLSLSTPGQVVMKNGIVQITLSSPRGDVIGIEYNGINNLLDDTASTTSRGYYDMVWNSPNGTSNYDSFAGTRFRVVRQTDNVVEVSFSRRWGSERTPNFIRAVPPLNSDKRYVMLRGSSGFYTYIVMEHEEGWPDFGYGEARKVYRLNKMKFTYMAVSDKRQRYMPTMEDRAKGKPLAYPEAVLLPSGEVDDKYQYSSEDQDIRVHGWICDRPATGFWVITPSDEYLTCGPVKQDLTSHVGPITLAMFISTHYAGREVNTFFQNGERWKKSFGPIMIYLNSVASPSNNTTQTLWEDAKRQMRMEVERWPYNFTTSDDFPPSNQRGEVSGRLKVHDRYLHEMDIGGGSAHVGLAAPGDVGSWQRETKGYQFWTRADNKGNFVIRNVRAGTYALYAWVPGVLGDYMYEKQIEIAPGSKIQLGDVIYSPPRQGPTLWEIGIPDRSAMEFYVPDPYPDLVNKLFLNDNKNKFRQYGLWKKYADLYPKNDLVYTVGISDYHKDWFYAHVTRNKGNTYVPTTWQIRFQLGSVKTRGNYTLQLALASATGSRLELGFNDARGIPYCSTGLIGTDNAIARHGIHGLYWLFSFQVRGHVLRQGMNTIYITQSRAQSLFQGVMYDYIRLEGPPTVTRTKVDTH